VVETQKQIDFVRDMAWWVGEYTPTCGVALSADRKIKTSLLGTGIFSAKLSNYRTFGQILLICLITIVPIPSTA